MTITLRWTPKTGIRRNSGQSTDASFVPHAGVEQVSNECRQWWTVEKPCGQSAAALFASGRSVEAISENTEPAAQSSNMRGRGTTSRGFRASTCVLEGILFGRRPGGLDALEDGIRFGIWGLQHAAVFLWTRDRRSHPTTRAKRHSTPTPALTEQHKWLVHE